MRFCLFLLAMLVFLGGHVHAEGVVSSSDDSVYRLGAGDKIRLTVFGAPEV